MHGKFCKKSVRGNILGAIVLKYMLKMSHCGVNVGPARGLFLELISKFEIAPNS